MLSANAAHSSSPARRFTIPWLCVFVAFTVSACTPLPALKPSPPVDAAAAGLNVRPVAIEQDLPLQLLDGQFRLQGGDVKGGAQAYARAAELSPDPGLAEQATQLALMSADWPLALRAVERWQALAPKSPGILQARAWAAFGQGDDELAFATFKKMLDSGGEQVWRLLGQALLGVPEPVRAAVVLRHLATPERLGASEVTWLAMSQLAFKLGDKRTSQSLSDQAVTRFHGVESYAWNAHLSVDRGDKTIARDIFAQGLQRHPDSSRLRTGYAALLAELGDEREAARTLAGGVQDDATYAARMTYAVRADDQAALAGLYREVRNAKAAHTPLRLFLLGQLAELNMNYADAIDWYGRVPDEDERWFDSRLRQVVVTDQAGKTEQALELVRRLQSEGGIENDQVVQLFLLEADLLKLHKRNQEARGVYDRALSFLPDDVKLLYSRALLAAAGGDVKTAETDLRRVIGQNPEDAAALNALGYTLADRTDRYEEALKLIEQAHQLQPDEPSIIDSLGWVQFRLGRHSEAVATLREAYEKFPDSEVAAHYAEALWASGDRVAARKLLVEALRKEPGSVILLDTRKRLMP